MIVLNVSKKYIFYSESPFNKHTVCEQQTVGKTPQSKQTSIGSNIDYIHKSAEINVVARPSQLFGKICMCIKQ